MKDGSLLLRTLEMSSLHHVKTYFLFGSYCFILLSGQPKGLVPLLEAVCSVSHFLANAPDVTTSSNDALIVMFNDSSERRTPYAELDVILIESYLFSISDL